ncbi:MAG: hypothetical protein SH847_25540, partial [Roseiflexaceae bacterium]|nr:hypothetical protein [Roseiflexaceae bacterium]
TLIAGSTGSGKSTTIKHLLAQLWGKHRVPFLVLYPIDKPDYRELRGFTGLADDLLVFTLGDESTSPFRFNPFEVPDGLLLKTHLSRLMRVFMAAFTLQDPLPMIYREALRRVYREKGWDTIRERGQQGREYPIMSDFYTAISTITDSLKYGREVQDNVRQASVIRIGDLLENAGYVVNVRQSMPMQIILNQPTVMEIGRVGSAQDTTLLMGFLLMRFAEEVERNPRPLDMPHITVVEEAHRLMAESGPTSAGTSDSRGAAGEDFSNILAEVRGFGEGVIIAEQIPTLLVKGAIGNTYLKLMHWLEDAPSFDLFSNVMNLNTEQREYARTLTPGFALARSPYGRPVHVKVPEFGDQEGFSKQQSHSISDDQIRIFMHQQCERLSIADVPVVAWEGGLQASTGQAVPTTEVVLSTHEIASRLLCAPMQTCAFCRPLREKAICPFRATTLRHRADEIRQRERQETIAKAVTIVDEEERWRMIKDLEDSFGSAEPGAFYCLLAHEVDSVLQIATSAVETDRVLRKQYRRILIEYNQRYQGGT